jgi:hypothetical protein
MRSRSRVLHEALAAAAKAAPVADPFGDDGDPPSNRDEERCGILVRVTPDLRQQIKLAAIHRRTSVQALLLQAVLEVLKESEPSPRP